MYIEILIELIKFEARVRSKNRRLGNKSDRLALLQKICLILINYRKSIIEIPNWPTIMYCYIF